MWYYSAIALINALASSIFGTVAYIRNPHGRKNKLYAFYCLALSTWSCCYFFWLLSSSEHAALWLTRGLMMGAILIPVTHLHHLLALFDWKAPKLLAAGYVMAGIYLISNCTSLFITRVEPHMGFKYWPMPGPFFHPYLIGFVGYLLYCLFRIYRERQKVEGYQRNLLSWIFWATVIGYGGGLTNFPLCYNVKIPPFGNIFVLVYTSTVFYVLVKHRLMDIRIVIKKTVIYSTVTALLTALYVLITMGLVRSLSGWVMSPTAFSSAAAACAMALLFHPLRMKVQRFVDRHFFREALDQALLREATSGFVHEIKRPLTNISLPAQLSVTDLQDLADGRQPMKEVLPKVLERLRYIIRQTTEAGDKIEAIREFSDSNATYSNDIDLSEIIQRSVAAERSLLDRNQVHLKLDIAKDLPAIRGHKKQLEIVFSNLIKNAAEALGSMNAGSERSLQICACRSGAGVVIRIRDSGPGIKPENKKHLFEPYFTTKGIHGTGMGLYLCRQIVQAHGGTITVESISGSGAIFMIALPRVR